MCVCCHKLSLIFCDPPGLQPVGLLCPWHFPGKNTGWYCGGGQFLTLSSRANQFLAHWDLLPLGLHLLDVEFDYAYRPVCLGSQVSHQGARSRERLVAISQ